MDISIGSSSSSYKSERSGSSPQSNRTRLPLHHNHHQHHSTPASPTEMVDSSLTLGEKSDPLHRKQHVEEQVYSIPDSIAPNTRHSRRQENDHGKQEDDVEAIERFDLPIISVQQSLDAVYTVYSADPISPRFTPSSSAPFNPSVTSCSAAPPPQPPSPQSRGLPRGELFAPTVPRYSNPSASPFPLLSTQEKEKDGVKENGEADGYLSRAVLPADPSSPPRSPPRPSTSAFARTESPSPLRKLVAADAPMNLDRNGEEAPNGSLSHRVAHVAEVEKTSGTSDCSYKPLHIPTLKSVGESRSAADNVQIVNGFGTSSEAETDDADMRGLSEASESTGSRPHRPSTVFAEDVRTTTTTAVTAGAASASLPSRSAPPLPRPSPTAAKALPVTRLPSRSAESSTSLSLPRAAESRTSEERLPWGEELDNLATQSTGDVGGRPPSHARTMHHQSQHDDDAGWQPRDGSVRSQRSRSRSEDVKTVGSASTAGSVSHRREIGEKAVSEAESERSPQAEVTPTARSTSSLPGSAYSSTSSSSSSAERPSPAAHSNIHNDSNKNEHAAGQEHQPHTVSAADTSPSLSPPNAVEMDADVSSIPDGTPAQTARSSTTTTIATTVSASEPLRRSSSAGAVSATSKGKETMDGESPPPLPPAPWKSVTRDFAELKRAKEEAATAAAMVSERHTAQRDGSHEARRQFGGRGGEDCEVGERAGDDAPAQELSALERWRSGGAAPKDRGTAASPAQPPPVSSSNSSIRVAGGFPGAAVASPSLNNKGTDASYKGGVDFVRWVPSSVDRNADLSGTSLTPVRSSPPQRKEYAADRPSTRSSHLHHKSHTSITEATTPPRVVAVPLVPSPHRRPNRTAATVAVLAEVQERRSATPGAADVPGGAAVNTTPLSTKKSVLTSSEAIRPRLRLSTITSPQLAREAQQTERSYIDAEEQKRALEQRGINARSVPLLQDNPQHHHRHVYGHRGTTLPVDTWGQQQRGRFLLSTTRGTHHQTNRPLFGSYSDAVSSLTTPDEHTVSLSSLSQPAASMLHDVQAKSSIGTGARPRTRPALADALASRSSRHYNVDADGFEGQSRSETELEPESEESDVPAVVRAWRPLSASIISSSFRPTHAATTGDKTEGSSVRYDPVERKRGTQNAAPVHRWACGVVTDTNVPKPSTTIAAAAATTVLSIDVSDTPASPSDSTSTRTIPAADTLRLSAKENATSKSGNEANSLLFNTTRGAVTAPGYAAVYSPRTLASRVLHARDAMLFSTRPQPDLAYTAPAPYTEWSDGQRDRETFPQPSQRMLSTMTSSLQPAHTASPPMSLLHSGMGSGRGSRVTPAIGAAVSAAAAAPTFTMGHSSYPSPQTSIPAPTPSAPHVRVRLSDSPSVLAPTVAEVLSSSSYNDTDAYAFAAAAQPVRGVVGSLAQRQSERVARAIASEPWSLYVDDDNIRAERTTEEQHSRQTSQQDRNGVSRKIPFESESALDHERDGEAFPRSIVAHGSHPHDSRVHGDDETAGDVGHARYRDHSQRNQQSQRNTALSKLRQLEETAEEKEENGSLQRAEGSRRGTGTHVGSAPSLSIASSRGAVCSSSVASRTSPQLPSSSPSSVGRHSNPRSTSTAAPAHPSQSRGASAAAVPTTHTHENLTSVETTSALAAVAERNARHACIIAQQRLVQEETFRRRQIEMQQEHTLSMAVTELNYQRAVQFVHSAQQTWSPPVASAEVVGGSVSVSPASTERSAREGSGLRGLPAVRQDQASMARALGKLSNELDMLSP